MFGFLFVDVAVIGFVEWRQVGEGRALTMGVLRMKFAVAMGRHES
jgi:hypothetical protein